MSIRTTKYKIMSVLAVIGILCFCLVVSLGLVYDDPREWHGGKIFASIDEAQQYQKLILETAKEYKATRSDVTISIASPPTVIFDIYLPSKNIFLLPQDTYFPYGNQLLPAAGSWAVAAFVVGFFLIISIIFLKDDWQGKLR